MPGRPSSDASGRLNGSRLVNGDACMAVLLDDDDPSSVTSGAEEEEDCAAREIPSAPTVSGEFDRRDTDPDMPPLAPAPRGEEGVAEEDASIADAAEVVEDAWETPPEIIGFVGNPPSSPTTLSVTAARDQSV